MSDRRWDNPITDYCFDHYMHNGLCTLCGNWGVVDTTGLRSPAGVEVGRRNYCICPNGQAMREGKFSMDIYPERLLNRTVT